MVIKECVISCKRRVSFYSKKSIGVMFAIPSLPFSCSENMNSDLAHTLWYINIRLPCIVQNAVPHHSYISRVVYIFTQLKQVC